MNEAVIDTLRVAAADLMSGNWNSAPGRTDERARVLNGNGISLLEVLDALPAAIYLTDAKGRLTFFNKAAIEFSGRVPELGTDHWCVSWKLYDQDENPLPHDECPMAIAITEGRAVRGAVAIAERPDGSRRWFQPYPTPVFDGEGRVIGGINMLVDITDQRLAQEKRLRAEAELRDFVENATVGLHWVGPDGKIIWANSTELKMLGYERDEYIGRHIDEFHADEATISDILQRLARGESLENYEARLMCKDGSIREVLISSNVLWENGEFVHTRCFTRDITDRKQAERMLEQDLKDMGRLRELGEWLTLETDLQIVYGEILNAAIELMQADAGTVQMLDPDTHELKLAASKGFSSEMTMRFSTVRASSDTTCGAALREGTRAFVDFDEPGLPDPDGCMRAHVEAGYSSAQSTPLITRTGEPIGMFSTHWRKQTRPTERQLHFLDLLARQAADLIEHRRSEEELRRSHEREKAARREAEDANRAKDDFLATLSHELRTPLHSMMGWTQILQRSDADETTSRRGLETIARCVKLQHALIEDLLDVSRIITGRLHLEEGTVSLLSVVQSALDAAAPEAEGRGVAIKADLDLNAYELSGDRHRLEQIVANLVTNSMKFTPAGGTISVRLRSEGEKAVLTVADDGIGIPPALLPRIFDRFTQVDGSMRRRYGGLGLGLTIVKHLVELHGGTIAVHSEGEGKGAAFTVELPLARRMIANADLIPAAVPDLNGRVDERRLAGRTVFLVDDDADALEWLAFALRQQGARVETFTTAAAAAEAISRDRCDLLISDIGMAEQSGIDLIRVLRRMKHTANLPAIALSGYVSVEDREHALASGFDAHLPKPVIFEQLLRTACSLIPCDDDE
jgi:PAS domain S-box-containing protein